MVLLYDLVFYFSAYLPFVLIAAMPAYFFLKKQNRRGIQFSVAILLTSVIVELLKGLFNVPRPFGKPGLSFPSGHASLAAAEARFFKTINKKQKAWQAAAGIIYVAFIAAGRVYTGFHTVQDVAAGALIGYAISELAVKMLPKLLILNKKSR